LGRHLGALARVEVLSRSSRVYDREFKRDAYIALGVQQVWLVDWWDGFVEVCTQVGKTERFRGSIEWVVPAANVTVTMRLAELFAGV
jgi:Uma2 family endonuclease